MALPIADYAVIGDCQTAALVGRDGSIDWLCFPRFDSPACFAALLGAAENGRWLLAPATEVTKSTRRYRLETLTLETDFETADGDVRIVDCMPPRGEQADLVRLVIGLRGRVAMRMELIIRFDYGQLIPWVTKIPGGIQAISGPDKLLLHAPVELVGKDFRTTAEFTVEAGEQVPFVLTWLPSHKQPDETIDVTETINATDACWRRWSSRCSYEGPWKEAVVRSLLTLKALTYAPTGGIVAAVTTSLPEQIGGERNWDYRYCWVRDATFTLYALLLGGYHDEAKAWRDWLLRAAAGDPAKLLTLYGLAGERHATEMTLDWLGGYEGSRPVRIGNAAAQQFQLDVYGEAIDMMHQCRRAGIDPEPAAWGVERALLDYVRDHWREPDEGIWEVRGPRQHFTHSKILAWVALDRAVKAVERYGLKGPVIKWRKLRDQMHAEICERGFNRRLNAFVQVYDTDLVDASLLMTALVGFLPASDPRVQGTVAAIERELLHDGFVHRYKTHSGVDGLPPGEGVFLPCTFWLADNLSLMGRRDEAQKVFERLLALRNDVGLLSEEYDPASGRLLGNFPQAFTHVGLINTAYNLAKQGEVEHRRTS